MSTKAEIILFHI